MRFRKVIDEPIAHSEDGVNVAGGINAVVEANIGEEASRSATSSKQKIRVEQRGKRTKISRSSKTTTSSDE